MSYHAPGWYNQEYKLNTELGNRQFPIIAAVMSYHSMSGLSIFAWPRQRQQMCAGGPLIVAIAEQINNTKQTWDGSHWLISRQTCVVEICWAVSVDGSPPCYTLLHISRYSRDWWQGCQSLARRAGVGRLSVLLSTSQLSAGPGLAMPNVVYCTWNHSLNSPPLNHDYCSVIITTLLSHKWLMPRMGLWLENNC